MALASILAALLLGEALLRVLDQSYYWAVSKQPDPGLGWRPAANVAAWQRLEGGALVETNGLGFRDRHHALEKAPNTVPIVVLGDSLTEAVQVPMEQTWWRLMERTLNAQGCRRSICRPSWPPRPSDAESRCMDSPTRSPVSAIGTPTGIVWLGRSPRTPNANYHTDAIYRRVHSV